MAYCEPFKVSQIYNYAPLFVYVGEVSVEDVLNAVYVDFEITVLSPEDERTLSLLKCFIRQ